MDDLNNNNNEFKEINNNDLNNNNELKEIEYCIKENKKCYNVKIQHLEHPEDKIIKFELNLTNSTNFTLPSSIDLSKNMDYIYDQRNLGSCTANALCWAFRYKQRIIDPSRLFIYYNERYLDYLEGDNGIGVDDGSTLLQGVKSLVKYGVCEEKFYPYIVSKFAQKPSKQAFTSGELNQVLSYGIVQQNLNSMKKCLADGNPFVFGIYVYESYETNTVENTGIIPDPDLFREANLGGHALICIGYDDTTQRFKFANSYGRMWGDRGYGYISYNYLLNPNLTDDMWVIYTLENNQVPVPKPTPKPKKNKNKRNIIRRINKVRRGGNRKKKMMMNKNNKKLKKRLKNKNK